MHLLIQSRSGKKSNLLSSVQQNLTQIKISYYKAKDECEMRSRGAFEFAVILNELTAKEHKNR